MHDVMIQGIDREREYFVQKALYAAIEAIIPYMPILSSSQFLDHLLNNFYHFLMESIERHIHRNYDMIDLKRESIQDAIDDYAEGLGLSLSPDPLKMIDALIFHRIALPGLPLVKSKGGFSCV